MAKSILIAAPASGSGKTSICMGLIRSLVRRGKTVAGVKVGPDYIDSGWHSLAAGQRCWNVDAWAMRLPTQDAVMNAANDNDWRVVEGVMGLFDGAIDGKGSSFDVAKRYQLPIVFVVDASRQADSIAALVSGFHHYKGANNVAGIILNRVGTARHEALLKRALAPLNIPVLASLPTFNEVQIGSRHLGLFQAGDSANSDSIIDHLADLINANMDWPVLEGLAHDSPATSPSIFNAPPIFKDKKRIGVAHDAAFSFIYRHLIEAWQQQGSEIIYFSPLAGDDVPMADALYFPGGYPELHLSVLSQSKTLTSLKEAAKNDVAIYGECGGYMALGKAIVDSDGKSYEMAGLLPHMTSFTEPKRALGYRQIKSQIDGVFSNATMRGHEFHYTHAIDSLETLLTSTDALGEHSQKHGDRQANVAGSYLHIIDCDD